MSKWLRLRFLRYRMRNLASHLDWCRETLASGEMEVRKLEAAQKRLQSELWLLDRPGNIISDAIRRMT